MADKKRSMSVGAGIAAVPLALGLLGPTLNNTVSTGAAKSTPKAAKAKAAAAKTFSVPLSNLKSWAETVVVTVPNVKIEGRSKVHKLADDCEMHFGAHAPSFQGAPDGLVLEPMNACVQPFPGKAAQSDADWHAFGDSIMNKSVTASGVPRIWPEHLEGSTSPSNPNHAVELHPLTAIVSDNGSFDFAPNIFAGEYRGGVGEETALAIVEKTSISVVRAGNMVEIAFRGGRIGNFTVLDVQIERATIEGDGAGSLRMNGDVLLDAETAVPVRIVTAKGSRINQTVGQMKSGNGPLANLEALILFSVSPEALLAAANKSTNGKAVKVDRPLQLILYGTPDED